MAPLKYAIFCTQTKAAISRLATIKQRLEELASLAELTPAQVLKAQNYLSEVTRKRDDYYKNLNSTSELMTSDELESKEFSESQDTLMDLVTENSALAQSLQPSAAPLSPARPVDTEEHNASPFAVAAHVNLPRLDLPRFDGSPENWETFIHLFEVTIHRNPSMNNTLKLQYLVTSLEKEAKTLVQSLPIIPENYAVAYQLLKKRYDNVRRSLSHHLNSLFDLPDLTVGSTVKIRKFLSSYAEHTMALKALDYDVTLGTNHMLSTLLLRKLDNTLKHQLETSRVLHREESDTPVTHTLPSATVIIDFLTQLCDISEDAALHTASSSAKIPFRPNPRQDHFRRSTPHTVLVTRATNTSSNASRKPQPSAMQDMSSTPRATPPPARPSPSATRAASPRQDYMAPCFICQKSHRVYSCPEFISLSPAARYKRTLNANRCVNCLGAHFVSDCKSQRRCSQCDATHHSQFHEVLGGRHSSQTRSTPARHEQGSRSDTFPPPSPQTTLHVALKADGVPSQPRAGSTVVLGTALVALTSDDGHTQVFRALIDPGSTASFLTRRAANMLGGHGYSGSLQVTGVAPQTVSTQGYKRCFLSTLQGRQVSLMLDWHILDKLDITLPAAPLSPEVIHAALAYPLADPSFGIPSGIDILIGGAIYPLILTNECYSLGPELPHVMGTCFGFLVMGQASTLHSATPRANAHHISVFLATDDSSLHDSIRRFWVQEEPPMATKKSLEESQCDTHYSQTHFRDKTGRYVVSLPLKPNAILGDNSKIAEKRFHALETRFKRDPRFESRYKAFMEDYIQAGHMTKITALSSTSPLSRPHDTTTSAALLSSASSPGATSAAHLSSASSPGATSAAHLSSASSPGATSAALLSSASPPGATSAAHLSSASSPGATSAALLSSASPSRTPRAALLSSAKTHSTSALSSASALTSASSSAARLLSPHHSSAHTHSASLSHLSANSDSTSVPLSATSHGTSVMTGTTTMSPRRAPTPAQYFLPHHGVLKESSTTTKLRTVFDASCISSNGLSLNDISLTGPSLQINLCDLMLKFRIHDIVFSCDIRQMYRQVLVDKPSRAYQRILWRANPAEPISIYELNTVTYGVSSSPYLAIRTLHQLAQDEGHDFPEAAAILKHGIYVDDVVAGCATVSQALQIQSQLAQLLARGGFELRKWTSNSAQLLDVLPSDHLESPSFLDPEDNPHFMILGLRWSSTEDFFSYKVVLDSNSRSKRQILSTIAKIYDPCGFLAPLLMWCKCFMQVLWSLGLSWDDDIPPPLLEKWQKFTQGLPLIETIRIPRPLHLSSALSIQLHGFADASECGFAAVIYLRCELSHDVIVRPIIAKTRVAPLKRMTIPRLELCAAHLLAQLVAHSITVLSPTTLSGHYLWCDSTVALTWLRTPSHLLKTYVANRVAQTQELVCPEWWHYVPSAQNAADIASRGILPQDFPSHDIWWQGPPWLRQSAADWPSSSLSSGDDDQVKQEFKAAPLPVLSATTLPDWEFLTLYSSWPKLQRITAYILRFLWNSRPLHSTQRRSGPLSVTELKSATMHLIRHIQQRHFSGELTTLRASKPLHSQLRHLSPFLDTDGCIRVGGRLHHSKLSQDAKHPWLLPHSHPVVERMIDHYHVAHLHSGAQLTLSLLRQQFWILSARSAVRSRIFKCLRCFRLKPRTVTPKMADLPFPRVAATRPFSSTGMDYAGPFTIKAHQLRGTRQLKAYLCAFVCLSTKAVHLEVVTDLSTPAFLAALTRFVSRRGKCQHLYSDNGTNFVGAESHLRKTFLSLYKEPETTRYAQDNEITFHFNPPAAPHFGGLWEGVVKSVKHHLRRVLGEHILTLSDFTTLITQVEAMLNSRPLTPLSADPNDLQALTPGHFLIGGPPAALLDLDLSRTPTSRLRHFQLLQALQQRIWRRWHLEYLHTLHLRPKWTSPAKDLQVNDLVLLHTPSPPLTWPLGRITQVFPGSDGVIRTVEVKTTSGLFKRPTVQVSLLPF